MSYGHDLYVAKNQDPRSGSTKVRMKTIKLTKVILIPSLLMQVAFSALSLFIGRQQEHPTCKNWVTRCRCGCRLERGVDCLLVVQLMPLHPKTPSSLALFKSRLVLPFWYRLTQAWKRGRYTGVVAVVHRESKKTRHQTFGHNFTNYYPIVKIFSLADSVVNLQQIHV